MSSTVPKSEEIVPKAKTENGAAAWATSQLADNFGFTDENVNQLVTILVTLWSATGSTTEQVKQQTTKFIELCEGLVKSSSQNDSQNFMALMMAYVLHKRSVRHGGGRKDESRAALLPLCTSFITTQPELVKLLLKSYFTQGYWKDAWILLRQPGLADGSLGNPDEISGQVSDQGSLTTSLDERIQKMVLQILVDQIQSDSQIAAKLVLQANGHDSAERLDLIKQMSNCAKWCPQVKGEKKKKKKVQAKAEVPTDTLVRTRTSVNSSKKVKVHSAPAPKPEKVSNLNLILMFARLLFPTIEPDTWFYKNVNGKLDTSTKVPVVKNTTAYYRWRSLFNHYSHFMRDIRKQLPFVEKYLQKGHFAEVNPSMLTSQNKLQLNDTLHGQLPRYLKLGAKTVASKQMSKHRRSELRAKYGADRLQDEDRKKCADKYKAYLAEVAEKQAQKKQKIEDLKKKMKDIKSDDPEATALKEQLATELKTLQEEKTTNFDAGTPVDVWQAYLGSSDAHANAWHTKIDGDAIPAYEACIQELGMGKLADLANIPILNITDTSGSMYSGQSHGTIRNIDVSVAMTAFFAMFAPAAWKNKFIQFAGHAYVCDAAAELNLNNSEGQSRDPNFFEMCKFIMNNQINDTSTNFESVLLIMKTLFTGVNPADLPKYLIFWSDMQFNACVRVENHKLTAAEQLKQLFVKELGFAEENVPKIVFWNLAAHDNRPALASDEGVIMLSGFNPKMLLDLHSVINNTVPQAEFAKLEQELNELALQNQAEADRLRLILFEEQQKEKTVNTWKSMVQILSSNKATEPFLKEVAGVFPHTLLEEAANS